MLIKSLFNCYKGDRNLYNFPDLSLISFYSFANLKIKRVDLKKITVIAISLFLGLITVIYLNELIKGLIAGILTGVEVNYFFKGILLTAAIPFTKGTGISTYSFLYSVPFLMSVVFIEISSIILKKNNNLNLRQGIVVFQLVNVGYIVVNIFVGIISVVFKGLFTSNWARFLEYADIPYSKQLVIMLLILIFLFAYINYSTNRLRKYITIVKEK